jgi:hypothetical protein
MLCTFDRAMKEARAMPERLGRRRENRVVACLACGDTLAIYEEGARVPETPHDCATLDEVKETPPRYWAGTAVEREGMTPNEVKGA